MSCRHSLLVAVSLALASSCLAAEPLPKIDGYTQVRFNYFKPDDSAEDYDLGFQLAKGRLGVKGGMFDDKVSYRILTEFLGTSATSDVTATRLLDYYVTMNFAENIHLRAGQFKVPFTRQYYQSAAKHAFTDYALPVKSLHDGRDIGVEVYSENVANGQVEYHVGAFNGNGSNKKANDNTDMEVAGRMIFKWNRFNPHNEGVWGIAPGFAVGASGYTNHLSNAASEEKTGVGVDVTAGARGLFVAGEYVQVMTSSAGEERTSAGYYGQAGYMIVPKTLEILGRYAAHDPDSEAEDDSQTELRFGVAFFHSGHNHKVSVEGARITEETGPGDETNSIMGCVQYQFNFK